VRAIDTLEGTVTADRRTRGSASIGRDHPIRTMARSQRRNELRTDLAESPGD
jgi:hypothetical protein